MKTLRRIVASASLAFALALCMPIAQAVQPFRYQGFNIMAFVGNEYANAALVDTSLDYIVSRGSNFVVIDWNVVIDDFGNVLPPGPSSYEPPRADVLRLASLARQRGLRVFLKPHWAFPHDPFAIRGTWNTDMSKFSVDTFFPQWTTYLVGLANAFSSMEIDAIVIGSENLGFDSAYRDKWLSMIATLRTVFPGKIAYEAHFTVDEPQRFISVCFWDAVDIIGLSLYVALSKNDRASLAELNAAWHTNPYGVFGDIPSYLRSLSMQYNKPIMALEGGYQSIAGGLFDVGPVGQGRPVDNATQAAGIESYLDTLAKHQGDWFWGLSNWAVYPPHMDPANQHDWGYLQGYATNGKPAAEVIRRYFTGTAEYTDKIFVGPDGGARVFGSYANDVILAGSGNDLVVGGAGDDTIVSGPANLVQHTSAAVVIDAVGDIRASGGPKLRLVVNGQPVSDWIEVLVPRGATPQRIELVFPLGPRIERFHIETLPDPEFSNGVNRTVTIASISVNGVPMSAVDGASIAGNTVIKGLASWSMLYSGTRMEQDVSLQQAAFFGSPTDDDVIVGGPGNDTIDGGAGVNAVVYALDRSAYAISEGAGGVVTVTANEGSEGTDTLKNIALLQFADGVVDLRATIDAAPLVEYYNAALDHYFITWLPGERAALGMRGTPTPWLPTGYSFKAFPSAVAGASPVCRYYLPPQYGDSHFYGRGSEECNATGAADPGFVLEDASFVYLSLPSAGTCPLGTRPVYRVFSGRADANHRYTTDRAVRDAMVAKGWVAEGDGPDRVVLCAPP